MGPGRPHRRCTGDDGDAVLRDGLERGVGVEPLDGEHAAARVQGEPEDDVQAEDVEERQHTERDVVGELGA